MQELFDFCMKMAKLSPQNPWEWDGLGLSSPGSWRDAAAWATHILPVIQSEGVSHWALQVKYCQKEEKEEN